MRQALNVEPYNFYNSINQLESKKSNIFLLIKENNLVGSVVCSGNEIDDLIVNKKYQKQGHGKKLLMFAVNHIQKQNCHPINLYVAKWNESAVKLYEKSGFNCVHIEEIE